MLPWQEKSLLCQMFVTCSYTEQVFGSRFWAIMANFVLKFSHFRCHGTVWYNICGSISCVSRVLAIFMLKFPNFRYHGIRGRSDINFNDTSKLPDLENPLFGAKFVALFLVLAEF